MKSTKPKIRRKKKRSTIEMNFVTAVKKSGSVEIKKLLVPLSSSALDISLESQTVKGMVDQNNELTFPDVIGN